MALNAKDGVNRQFIMVQLPEITDEKSEAYKAGYKNICEIGKERIRRAGKKILENHLALSGHPFKGGEYKRNNGELFPSQGGVSENVPSKNSPLWRDVGEANGVVNRNTRNYLNLPYNPNLTEKAKELRKAGNLSEVLLWNQLKNKQFNGLDFDRQKIIGNYIVDFYCASHNVVLEVDGCSHDNKGGYDKERDNYLKNLGLDVIHILDADIKNNMEGVMVFLHNHPAFGTPPQEGNEGKRSIPPQEGNEGKRSIPPQEGNYLDIGFKVFKLDTSNLVKWDDTPTDNTEILKERFDSVVKTLKFDRSELDVVYEVMLKLGIPLTYRVNEITVNSRKVYSIGEDGLILVCLDGSNNGITPEDITVMCDLAPAKIVAAEEAFKDDIALSNAYYISKDKGIEIELL